MCVYACVWGCMCVYACVCGGVYVCVYRINKYIRETQIKHRSLTSTDYPPTTVAAIRHLPPHPTISASMNPVACDLLPERQQEAIKNLLTLSSFISLSINLSSFSILTFGHNISRASL